MSRGTLTRTAVPVLLALALLPAGCGSGGKATEATAKELAMIPNGTQLISPISQKAVVKSPSTPAVMWDGKIYLFCCETDKDRFKQSPEVHSRGVPFPNGAPLSFYSSEGN